MKKIIVINLLLILMSCNAIREFNLQAKSDIQIMGNQTIPFNYLKKLIIIEAKIHHLNTANQFIFDTGAFQSKVEFDLAQTLQLSTLSKRKNSTAQGIEKVIEIVNLDSVKFSNATFFNIGAGKLKYDSASYSPCVAGDGIVGSNLLKLAYWKIDYQKKEIEISAKPIFQESDKEWSKIDFSTDFLSGIPLIDVRIEGQTIKDVVFDMGYNGGLVVPYKYSKKFQTAKTQTIIDQSTAGIFGANKDKLLIKELNVELGGFGAKIPVEFSSLNKALIGNDFLEHFTVYLNYKSKDITLEPNTPIEIDKVKTFIPSILNDSLWLVNRTAPEIPLNLGDTLTAINGYQPKDLFNSHCDHFLNIAKLYDTDTFLIETVDKKIINLNLND